MLRLALLALASLAALPSTARAHVFEITDVVADLSADSYRIDVTVDVDALALGVSPETESSEVAAVLRSMSPDELDAAVARAVGTLSRRVRVRFDDAKVRPEIGFPDAGTEAAEALGVPSVLGVTARLSGSIPEGASEFRFGLSRSFGESRLLILRGVTEVVHLLGVGEDSPAFSLVGPVVAPSGWRTFARYTRLGFLHIVPRGADHILFVLGLFLAGRGLRDLLIRITAFTVAHTVTLGISAAGIFAVPGRWVEPLIALSIVWIAVEAVLHHSWSWWRTGIVFGFGLLHGLGFAGVLGELGLPEGSFVPALLGFNLGVELGQVSVVLAAWLVLHRFRGHPAYRARVSIPLSVAIGAVGLFWAVQRVFF
jgi:hypothetical protein